MPAGRGADGLPRAFLQSLRPLFDILDDRRRGCVHLREIESRWRLPPDGEGPALPPGVLEGLRRAAPPSGYLTFERFVLGLRASLPGPADPASTLPPGPADGRAPAHEGASGSGAGRAPRAPEKTPVPAAEQTRCTRPGTAAEAGGTQKPAGLLQNESRSRVVESRKQPRCRGEHRRHTITGGVDYAMLKQMKELEKEKDFLLQGLEVVDRAREWYLQQIHILQEHQKQLGKSKVHRDSPSEGSLSQLHLLVPKLQELNRCLCELLSLAAKPPSPCGVTANSPACATAAPPPLAGPQQTIAMLKEQNWLLTKEVTDKSERITQLQQEKSALIKQLFEARALGSRESNQLDSTFI
ncbi:suppressor APC domain-containing protein 2 [Varanus komodoensis]|uniref:suppressor APC domain-containing protein 2 n=1 Tax=Varanus komodoensis TaxID=61221 RepID=UPI001CF794A4|nr:suppressor APC domain-containing protein 2 [Varanus komodoensis]